MAITSSAICWNAKQYLTAQLGGLNTSQYYQALGIGNDSTIATENTTLLIGAEQMWKDGNFSYFKSAVNNSYIAQWNSTWIFNDLTSNICVEVGLATNGTNATTNMFLRGVYNEVILGAPDALGITVQIAVTEG